MDNQKTPIIEKYKIHPTDTGSPEVQVALLTTKINHLGEHFKKFPKDFTSRAGFLKMISQRRRLLDYLKKHSMAEYKKILTSLNLRK